MATKEETERESWLVLHAQAGDREALDALLKTLQLPLYRYLGSLVRDDALAEDVLQEVFLRIYRHLHWLREPQLLRPWAYRIATNEAFRQLKREQPWDQQVRAEEVMAALPADEANVSEWLAVLPSLLAELSPASRAVIVLHYLHELALDEVAAVLDIPLGTVKSRLAYGLSRLRQQICTNHAGGAL